ncbi:MAG: 4Fe-4S binding protein [Chloroflexota bacterium]
MFYGLGLIKGLAVTMTTAFKPWVTVQYPDRRIGLLGAAKEAGANPFAYVFQQPGDALKALIGLKTVPVMPVQSTRFRGNEFTWYEDRCTGCASCAKYCPLGIIEIVTSRSGNNMQEGETYNVDVFDIDTGRCMFCALCVEACPYDALHMGTNFERGNALRDNLVITKGQLNEQPKRPSTWFRPQMEEREYDPYREDLEDHKGAGRHEQPAQETLRERWVHNRETAE